jgi:hypothetical protein
MSNITTKLKMMEMDISDCFLVHFTMISLPQFSHLAINYNNREVKWSGSELITRYVQEEERLNEKS